MFGTHTQKTHLATSLPLLPPLTFPFLCSFSRSLCLCTQTNQSSFDLLEMSLASERHFECDEWDEGGGRTHWKSGMADTVTPFSAERVLSNSRARLLVALGGNCFLAKQRRLSDPAFSTHALRVFLKRIKSRPLLK